MSFITFGFNEKPSRDIFKHPLSHLFRITFLKNICSYKNLFYFYIVITNPVTDTNRETELHGGKMMRTYRSK
jgi:hypothetical protein